MQDLLTPGQIFASRYRIDRFLAKGGFGAVYAAEQIETELAVALKVLWPHVLHSKDAVEKFKLEARVAGRVGSEHIVRVFDAGFDASTEMPFLVMELLQGAHLQQVIETQGPLAPDALVRYFRQIASALDKAHGYKDKDGASRPIVHRDLKPENLFLSDRETGEPIVKVLDFGIAKVLSGSTNVSQEVKGTPLYMAFEQASSDKITPQTDIWALGLIGFFLLTGKNYWKTANREEASLMQLFGEVLSLPIEPPSQRARELGCAALVTPGFDTWFARCVNRETAARFATAGECANALAIVLLGASAPQRGVPSGIAFGATAPMAGAPAITAPAPLTGPSASAVGATTAQPLSIGTTGAAPDVPKKSRTGLVVGALLVGAAAAASAATLAVRRGSDSPETLASASPSAEAASAGLSSSANTTPVGVNPALSVASAASSAAPAASVAPAASSTSATLAPPVARTRPHAQPQPVQPKPEAGPTSTPTPVKREIYDDR